MNRDQIKKSIGTKIRFRPRAVTLQGDVVDDDWILTNAEDDHIVLQRVGGGHIAKIGYDQLYGYTSDPLRNVGMEKFGFLNLFGRLMIDGARIEFEPAPAPRIRDLDGPARPAAAAEKNGDATHQAWIKLKDATDATQVVYASYRSYPDLDRLSDADLNALLNRTVLTPEQGDHIRAASRKNDLFMEYASWIEVSVATDKVFDVKGFVDRQLTIPQSRAEKFLLCAKFLLDALNDYNSWKQMSKIRPEPSIRREGRQALDNALKLAKDLERELRPPA